MVLLAVAAAFVVREPCTLAATPSPSPAVHAAARKLSGYEIIRLGRGRNNRLCLAMTVDGVKGLIIVDTGASNTLLNADKYGFIRADPARKLPPGTPATVSVNGMRVPLGMARQLELGQIKVGSLPVVLVGRRYLYDAAMPGRGDDERQYDGLLGEDILRHFNAVADCGRMALYLNTDPRYQVHLGNGMAGAGYTRVPMSDLHRDFTVPCEINGHAFRVLVDTGAPFTSFDSDLLAGAGLPLSELRVSGGLIGAKSERLSYGELPGLKIGGYAAARTYILAGRSSRSYFERAAGTGGPPILGLLGGDFLSANQAVVDVGGHALYLKRNR